MSEKFLNIYAQHYEHSHAHIVGTPEALAEIRGMIDKALAFGCSEEKFLAFDGEEYQLRVVPFKKDNPVTLAKPYTDNASQEKSDTVVWPHQLCVRKEGKDV